MASFDRCSGLTGKCSIHVDLKSDWKRRKHRLNMERNCDRRHVTKIPKIESGYFILVRRDLEGSKAAFGGPCLVMKTTTQEKILKKLFYQGPHNIVETVAVGNILPYHPRTD